MPALVGFLVFFFPITPPLRVSWMYACCIGEIGKLLGAKWKELDESEKKVCRFVIGLWLRICF